MRVSFTMIFAFALKWDCWCRGTGRSADWRLSYFSRLTFIVRERFNVSYICPDYLHVSREFLRGRNSRIKHEHDPRVRIAHPRRALLRALNVMSLSLRFTEASFESSNHPAEWLHSCTFIAQQGICWTPSSFLREIRPIFLVRSTTIAFLKTSSLCYDIREMLSRGAFCFGNFGIYRI